MSARGSWPPSLALAGIVVITALPGLGNGFVYDDVPMVAGNDLIHRLASAPQIWGSSYFGGQLYRPVTVQAFALEWAAGGGRPIVFHAVSIALAVATALILWRLAARILPGEAAFTAAALFAVHPVHVEAVANVVGQCELLASLFGLLAVERYLAWRPEGPLAPGRRAALAALTLLSILSKETGYVVPLLLAVAEATVVPVGTGEGRRFRGAVGAFQLQVAAVAASVLLRLPVLGFSSGTLPATPFAGLTTGERAVAMLAVVPHWFRLLLWPAHLQAEYGPPALAVTGTMGAAHLAGLALLLAAATVLVLTWRKAPAAAFGLAWAGIALLPVSNVATATGVVLAERTLYLPSAGMMLAVATGWEALRERGSGRAALRSVLYAATALLLALGAARTRSRSPVWKDQDRFFAQMVLDAPTTSRAHKQAAQNLEDEGRMAEAEAEWLRAYQLDKRDPRVFEGLGQVYRARGRCDLAFPVFQEGLSMHPTRTILRARYIECKLTVGDTSGARALAEEGIRLGQSEFEGSLRRLTRRSTR